MTPGATLSLYIDMLVAMLEVIKYWVCVENKGDDIMTRVLDDMSLMALGMIEVLLLP